jgi:hypothetical protein
MFVPVADVHGYLESDTLRKFYKLFNIFIIHISNRPDDIKFLKEETDTIRRINPAAMIITIEHDDAIV